MKQAVGPLPPDLELVGDKTLERRPPNLEVVLTEVGQSEPGRNPVVVEGMEIPERLDHLQLIPAHVVDFFVFGNSPLPVPRVDVRLGQITPVRPKKGLLL